MGRGGWSGHWNKILWIRCTVFDQLDMLNVLFLNHDTVTRAVVVDWITSEGVVVVVDEAVGAAENGCLLGSLRSNSTGNWRAITRMPWTPTELHVMERLPKKGIAISELYRLWKLLVTLSGCWIEWFSSPFPVYVQKSLSSNFAFLGHRLYLVLMLVKLCEAML